MSGTAPGLDWIAAPGEVTVEFATEVAAATAESAGGEDGQHGAQAFAAGRNDVMADLTHKSRFALKNLTQVLVDPI